MLTRDFVFLVQDNQDPSPRISCTLIFCELEDAAGNTTTVEFVKKQIATSKILSFKSIRYNNQTFISLVDNILAVNYTEDRGQIKSFQAEIIKKQQVLAIIYDRLKTNPTFWADQRSDNKS